MKALLIATDGFEDSEFSYPYYRFQEAGWEVSVATPTGDSIEGKHGYTFDGDVAIDEYDPSWFAEEFDLVFIPGGSSPEALRVAAPEAADIVSAFDDAELPVVGICHAAQLFISAGILDGRTATGYWSLEVDIENAGAEFVDEPVVVDSGLLTARVPGDLPALLEAVFNEVDTVTESPVEA